MGLIRLDYYKEKQTEDDNDGVHFTMDILCLFCCLYTVCQIGIRTLPLKCNMNY